MQEMHAPKDTIADDNPMKELSYSLEHSHGMVYSVMSESNVFEYKCLENTSNCNI